MYGYGFNCGFLACFTIADQRHTDGATAEAILVEWLTRRGWYVFLPFRGNCPVDVVAINERGEMMLLDSKKDVRRRGGPQSEMRISRGRTETQKRLGVRLAYVNVATREVLISEHKD